MSTRMRTYYYAIFGAMGGLFGWRVTETTIDLSHGNIYITNIWLGSIIGFFIGFLIGASADLLKWSLPRIVKSGFSGGIIGLIAGAISLPLAELIFQLSGAGLLGRAFSWAVFGSIIGLSEGIIGGSRKINGFIGGAVGGAIGGAALELIARLVNDLVVGKIIGLMLLGAFIGIFIALVVILLRQAWIEIGRGKTKGEAIVLDKFISSTAAPIQIGSDPKCRIYIIGDKNVEPEHAVLRGETTHFILQNLSSSGTYVGDRIIDVHTLVNGDTIRVGNTELVYYEKR
ncbi:MAG: FHA domain-containing protein [Anaerolineales bacterium]|nr:FHA domain-containing protein [Anaerolineales bacterium]